jgi:hypothetical protein
MNTTRAAKRLQGTFCNALWSMRNMQHCRHARFALLQKRMEGTAGADGRALCRIAFSDDETIPLF